MPNQPLVPNSYRPDIDGLRSIAVLGVIFYHLNDRWLSGGFVGVDVFFVISGYLISSIIARDIVQGQFSIERFYQRRIKRIFPALLAMLLLVALVSWFLLLPSDLEAFAKSIRYAVIGISNLLFYKNTQDYFNDDAATVPLMHTWSLGVEEQFYLFFPLLLWGIYRTLHHHHHRIATLITLALISLAASIWILPQSPMAAFFLLPFRSWELLLGAIFSLANFPLPNRNASHTLGLLGLAMVASSMVFFHSQTPFPGLSALLPCLGSALLLWIGQDSQSLSSRLLSLKPMVAIGLISYSLYLWHWPLIIWTKYLGALTTPLALVILAASFLLAYASWRWIEQPVRTTPHLGRKSIWLGWIGACSALIACGALLKNQNLFPNRFSPTVTQLLSYRNKPAYWTAPTPTNLDQAPVLGTANTSPSWALWGDSHGTAIMPVIDDLAQQHHLSFKKFGFHGCPPIAGIALASANEAKSQIDYAERVLSYLETHPNIHSVILHGRWSLYNMGKNEKGSAAPTPFFGHHFADAAAQQAFYFNQIRATLQRLTAAGKKVILIGPVPEVGTYVPDFLAKHAMQGKPIPDSIANESFFSRNQAILNLFAELQHMQGVTVVYPHQVLYQNGQVRVLNQLEVFYHDDDHLSRAGALSLKPLIQPALF